MVITQKIAIALTSLSLLGAGACTNKSPQEKKAENRQEAAKKIEEKREDIGEVRTDTAEKNAKVDAESAKTERDAFVKAADGRLDKVKDRLDDLEKRVDKQADAVKTAASTKVIELKGVHAGIKSMLKDVDDNDKIASWAQLRTEVDTKIKGLENDVSTLENTMTAH